MTNSNRRAKCPWFKFFPTDFLGDKDVAIMSVEEIGAYCLLLFYSWQEDPRGSLPDNDAVLARMARMNGDQWERSRCNVLAPFRPSDTHADRIVQPRMVDEALSAESRRQSLSDAGKRGAQKRWHSGANGGANGEAIAVQKPEAISHKPNAKDNSPNGLPNPSAGELYTHGPVIQDAWSKIPAHKRSGLGRFRTMWIEHVTRAEVDPNIVAEAISKYYESDQGRGEYARGPARLVADLIWEESPDAWTTNQSSAKAVDELDRMLSKEEL